MSITWSESPLGEIAPAASNGMFPNDAEVWNLSLEEIQPITGRIANKAKCKVSSLGSAKCSFDARHVLYSKLRPYLNKVVLPDEPGVGTSELIPLLPDQRRLDREYLAYYMRSPIFTDYANANTRGANLPRISMPALWQHKVPFPISLEEQRRIVARIRGCMERVDEIDRLRAQTDDEIIRLRNAIPDEIGRAGDWPQRAVGDLVLDTRNGRSLRTQPEKQNGFILSLSAVHDVDLNIESRKPTVLSDSLILQFGIRRGDIFISRANTSELVGLASIVTETPKVSTIYPDLLIKLDTKESIIRPRYLVYALRTFSAREQIRNRAIGTSQSMVKISAGRLREVMIPLPPPSEQDRLISRLDQLVIATANLRAETLSESGSGLREAILRAAFTGE
jgi:type I restriction enzyme S subunit